MTCATGVAVIPLLDWVGDPEVEVEVGVGVQDARITSTRMNTGRTEVVGTEVAVMKRDQDTDITGKDDSLIHYLLCIT